MEMEKNFTSSMDFSVLEEVKPKRSLEATILCLKLHYESKTVTGTGHYAWTSCRIQEAGKPWMRWLDSIKEATGLSLEALKETVQDREKWRMLVEEKIQNRECTNVK
jgi:hypothetical protein